MGLILGEQLNMNFAFMEKCCLHYLEDVECIMVKVLMEALVALVLPSSDTCYCDITICSDEIKYVKVLA